MRKELGDHFVRLLEAIFTIKPSGGSSSSLSVASETGYRNGTPMSSARDQASPELIEVLLNDLPAIEYLLGESIVSQMVKNISHR